MATRTFLPKLERSERDAAAKVAGRNLAELARPFDSEDTPGSVHVGIDIVIEVTATWDVKQLLRNADLATYAAKRHVKNVASFSRRTCTRRVPLQQKERTQFQSCWHRGCNQHFLPTQLRKHPRVTLEC